MSLICFDVECMYWLWIFCLTDLYFTGILSNFRLGQRFAEDSTVSWFCFVGLMSLLSNKQWQSTEGLLDILRCVNELKNNWRILICAQVYNEVSRQIAAFAILWVTLRYIFCDIFNILQSAMSKIGFKQYTCSLSPCFWGWWPYSALWITVDY